MITKYLASSFDVHSKFLLIVVACTTLPAFTAMAQVSAAAQVSHQTASRNEVFAFDVASIRPSRSTEQRSLFWGLADEYRAKGMPLLSTIIVAYSPPYEWLTKWGSEKILGAPPWVRSELYDIDAKVAAADLPAWKNQGAQKKVLQSMLQTMLAERCQLVLHRTTVEVPVYALVVGKHGTKLRPANVGEPLPNRAGRLIGGATVVPFVRSDVRAKGEVPKITFLETSMESFAAYLSGLSNRPVADRTGLIGSYDFELQQNAELDASASDPAPASRFNVEELGLKLVPMKLPIEGLTIDHIEKPTIN
jgi:uncharacterized protein (TIGR03435 family)